MRLDEIRHIVITRPEGRVLRVIEELVAEARKAERA